VRDNRASVGRKLIDVSPTSVWRVLGQAGLLSKWNGKPSKKGKGFEQPLAVHQHWHIDVSYINISGTFYLCSVLDGCSRYIVNWDLRDSMTEADIEVILERAKELHPEAKPRIMSDNVLTEKSRRICWAHFTCHSLLSGGVCGEAGSRQARAKKPATVVSDATATHYAVGHDAKEKLLALGLISAAPII
jgi:transposase InsO family protein